MNKRTYKRAAEMIANNRYCYCCDALVSLNCNRTEFIKIFKPTKKELSKSTNFIGNSFFWGTDCREEDQMARSLALLFMAEMESK